MKILALDLGTKTGWASGKECVCDIGTWTLASPKQITEAGKTRMSRRLDPRIPALYQRLEDMSPDYIVFEDVQFSSTTMQTQLWASLRAVVWLYAAHKGIGIECVSVSTLKKFATGHGGATKNMMAASLSRKYPNQFYLDPSGHLRHCNRGLELSLDDNAVDAAHLLFWAIQTLRK